MTVIADRLISAHRQKKAKPAPIKEAQAARPLPFNDPTPEDWQ